VTGVTTPRHFFDSRKIPFSEFAGTVINSLESSYSVKGDSHRGVIISELNQARGLSAKLVLIPGMLEGLFPSRSSQDPILLDRDRAALNKTLGNTGGPLNLSSRRDREESLLYELALESASNKIVFSFPRIEQATGKSNLPSWFILELIGRLSGDSDPLPLDELSANIRLESGSLIFHRVPLGEFIPSPTDSDIELLLGRANTEWELTRSASRRLAGADPRMARSYINTELEGSSHPLKAIDARLSKERLTEYEANVDESIAKKSMPLKWSPSALEKYASCPFGYFLKYVLGLYPARRPEGQSDIPYRAVGNAFHSALEQVFQELKDDGKLPLTKDHSQGAIERLENLIEESLDAELMREPAASPVLKKGLIEALEIDAHGTIDAEIRESEEAEIKYTPTQFELAFDSVNVDLPTGRHITLKGTIDRVDRSENGGAQIIDYKWSKDAKTASSLEGGTQLQPMLYLLAMCQLDPTVSLKDSSAQYRSISHLSSFDISTLPGEEALAKLPNLHELLGMIIDNIEAGVFPPLRNPRDDEKPFGGNRCKYCEFDLICKSVSPAPAVYKAEAPEFEHISRFEDIE